MSESDAYLERTIALCRDVAIAERDSLAAAADLIAEALAAGRRWWVFGTGHSHLLVEELWGRAGGLVDVHPILEPSLMLHEGLQKSSQLERLPGLAAAIASLHDLARGDVILIVSNSGRNAVPVELATLARERGLAVVALTSVTHSSAVASRAPSGARLMEVADVIIDNHGVVGDAILHREAGAVGATSTVIGSLLVQALSVAVTERLDRRGMPPAVYTSLNA